MEKCPQFRQPVELYEEASSARAAQGSLVGAGAQVKEAIKRPLEEMVVGGRDPIEALNGAAANATEKIRKYERRVKPWERPR
jgi:hypothetical protein